VHGKLLFVMCALSHAAADDICLWCRCVLELHAIASKKEKGGGRFAVAMTAQENERFLTGIKYDPKEYYSMLGRVDAEASDCSREADRESIHEGIRCSVGFAKLNRMVFGVMEGWMEEMLRVLVSLSSAAGGDMGAVEWNTTLAIILFKQGRLDEAAAIQEKIMAAGRIEWGENDQRIGMKVSTCAAFCVHLTRFITGQASGNLASTYLKLGRHQDALVLLEKTLEIRRNAHPRNHLDLGVVRLYWSD
jgi:hypothetical protein